MCNGGPFTWEDPLYDLKLWGGVTTLVFIALSGLLGVVIGLFKRRLKEVKTTMKTINIGDMTEEQFYMGFGRFLKYISVLVTCVVFGVSMMYPRVLIKIAMNTGYDPLYTLLGFYALYILGDVLQRKRGGVTNNAPEEP